MRNEQRAKGKMKHYFGLPNLRNFITRDILIGSNERHFLRNCSCDKQAVKWVPVNYRQIFKGGKMGRLNRENGKSVIFSKTYKPFGFPLEFQFTKTCFYSKFLCGRNTKIFFIGKVKNCLSSGLRDKIIAIEKPHSCMSIKQIMPHLHIILKILKRSVKIISNFELSFSTAKYRNFFRFSICQSKSDYCPSPRIFARNFNGNTTAINRNINSLSNGHVSNIA